MPDCHIWLVNIWLLPSWCIVYINLFSLVFSLLQTLRQLADAMKIELCTSRFYVKLNLRTLIVTFSAYTLALKWYETFNTNNLHKNQVLTLGNLEHLMNFSLLQLLFQTLGSTSQDFFLLGVDKSAYLANAHSITHCWCAVVVTCMYNSLYS